MTDRKAYMKEFAWTHREEHNAYNRRWYREHREQVREQRRDHWRRRGSIIKANRARAYRARRLAVLTHYGHGKPRCACCGTAIWEFLNVDHIDDGGNKQRRELGLFGSNLITWLYRNGMPPGYQVMCFNCNIGRYLNGGVCPHLRKARAA